jgi:3-methyladenine DNA glycosylase AlkD
VRSLERIVMAKRRITANYIADHIRRVLKDGGSAPHSEGVQRFFKEEIQSRGWYTAELRKVAVRFRRTLLRERGMEFLLEVADRLFTGDVLEEKIFAVFLLEKQVAGLGDAEFARFERWLGRISTWADHDGLVHYVIGPMMLAKPRRTARVFRWAKSPSRWRRRAAAVALIGGARIGEFRPQIERVTRVLLSDKDAMVQKGVGWLLREWAKKSPGEAVPFLMKIRERAPRLVLRTACEKLSPAEKKGILAG